ncbi:uncharacterized protein LOC132702760 [Cylas formicarius]|uniref:uncharacterized protein LOC132702760 n=1 Tax=Cylas formicarius TaxID=197179 RepID=UPI00295875C6|nr:uncharacterized protein LOC132702760 [Cylas formicarius]
MVDLNRGSSLVFREQVKKKPSKCDKHDKRYRQIAEELFENSCCAYQKRASVQQKSYRKNCSWSVRVVEMKTDRPPCVSESRKIRKPLMEKKRRARINDSLETLKQMLLESKTTIKESRGKNGHRTAKMEKADILEMTVSYVQNLHRKLNKLEHQSQRDSPTTNVCIRPADSSSDCKKVGVALYPTKLKGGDIVFLVPSHFASPKLTSEESGDKDGTVWRPWKVFPEIYTEPVLTEEINQNVAQCFIHDDSSVKERDDSVIEVLFAILILHSR